MADIRHVADNKSTTTQGGNTMEKRSDIGRRFVIKGFLVTLMMFVAFSGVAMAKSGKYPAETVKIGFVTYDTTAQQVRDIKAYLDYLQMAFNFEIIWSESLNSAEGEFAFIEQCAAAGCKGIIGYYNEGHAESIKLAASLGMYYYGQAENAETYEAVKNSKYYLGGYYTGDANYDFGVAIVDALVKAGSHKIIVMSGGKVFGIPFFVDRYKGIMDGIKKAKESGYDIEMVYEVPGWPDREEFAAHQAAALQSDADGLAGTLTSLMWLHPMQNAGKFGKIKIAGIEGVSEDMVGLMKAGAYVGICAEIPGMFGMGVPMILNAVAGYGDKQRNADGSAPKIYSKNWVITDVDDLAYFAANERKGGTWAFDIDDVKSIMVEFNPEVTVEDMSALYSAVSADEIRARRAD